MISDILDLSKGEAGKIALEPKPIPVASTLDDILVIARGLANKKGQVVEAQIAPDLPPLQADPVRFKQILFNLLSNAVKFTPEGGTVRLTARRVDGRRQKAGSRVIEDCRLQIGNSAIRNPQSEIEGGLLTADCLLPPGKRGSPVRSSSGLLDHGEYRNGPTAE